MKQKGHIFIDSKSVVHFLNKKNTEIVNKENKYITKSNALNLCLERPWISSLFGLRDSGV